MQRPPCNSSNQRLQKFRTTLASLYIESLALYSSSSIKLSSVTRKETRVSNSSCGKRLEFKLGQQMADLP